MRLRSLASVILLFGLVRGAELAPCTGEDENGYYDLSPLRSKKDYTLTSVSGRKFTLNICQGVKSELWNPQHVDKTDTIGGFVRGDHGDFSIGTFNTTIRVAQKHPLLVYDNGSTCATGTNLRASTIIRFICDPAVFAAGSPVLVGQLPPEDDKACAFFFEWRTHVACPTAKSAGVGGFIAVFGSILLAAVLTYLVGVTLYNRFVLGYRGLDQLPTVSPLSSAAFTDCIYFVKDNFGRRDDGWVSSRPERGSGFGRGSGHAFGRGNGFGPSGGFGGDSQAPPPPRRDGFQALSQEEHERAPMLDARFSIDDRGDDQEYERRTSTTAIPPEVPQKSPSPRPPNAAATPNGQNDIPGQGAARAGEGVSNPPSAP